MTPTAPFSRRRFRPALARLAALVALSLTPVTDPLRAADPDGNVGPVTGDAHTVELAAGTGIVHIARGYDALNPDRGLAAILQTARHEFAHLNGLRQNEGGFDEAAQLATACGP